MGAFVHQQTPSGAVADPVRLEVGGGGVGVQLAQMCRVELDRGGRGQETRGGAVPGAGGYPGSPYFQIQIAGTGRTLAASEGAELVALPAFTGAPEQLWRIEQLPDGAWRMMPKAIPGSSEPRNTVSGLPFRTWLASLVTAAVVLTRCRLRFQFRQNHDQAHRRMLRHKLYDTQTRLISTMVRFLRPWRRPPGQPRLTPGQPGVRIPVTSPATVVATADRPA